MQETPDGTSEFLPCSANVQFRNLILHSAEETNTRIMGQF